MKPSLLTKLQQLQQRFVAVEQELSDPEIASRMNDYRRLTKERADLAEIVEVFEAHQKAEHDLKEVQGWLNDADLKDFAQDEMGRLKDLLEEQEAALQKLLLPKDPNDDRNVILEIRAGTGGDEASLFAADLMRMYSRFAEAQGWRVETMESSPSEVGGFKELVMKVSGEEVFRRLRYESGVHRVQRVPATEAQGRIHTSTATVAVLPESEEVDLEIKADEVRIEVCRSSGAGGQGVNTTDSAVQVMHLPTGIIVRCQDGRSQIKNKEKALTILRSRLLERRQQEEAAKYSAHRRSLIGSGGREEKIRTYNYPQNRVSDHRIELTLYNLDRFMEGDVGAMLDALLEADVQERLAEAGLR